MRHNDVLSLRLNFRGAPAWHSHIPYVTRVLPIAPLVEQPNSSAVAEGRTVSAGDDLRKVPPDTTKPARSGRLFAFNLGNGPVRFD